MPYRPEYQQALRLLYEAIRRAGFEGESLPMLVGGAAAGTHPYLGNVDFQVPALPPRL